MILTTQSNILLSLHFYTQQGCAFTWIEIIEDARSQPKNQSLSPVFIKCCTHLSRMLMSVKLDVTKCTVKVHVSQLCAYCRKISSLIYCAGGVGPTHDGIVQFESFTFSVEMMSRSKPA